MPILAYLFNLLGLACIILASLIKGKKMKQVPKWLIGLYALSFVAINLRFGGLYFYTFLAIAACMTLIMAILQKSGKDPACGC